MPSRSQEITASAVCAALYAVAKAATAFVPTPWGVGQFAPGVVVPALFAVIYGPTVAAVGAGIGVFVGDLFLSSTNPLLSLIAGVTGNFVGFYLMGALISHWKSWRTFIWASFVSLTVGNLIAAAGVVFYMVVFVGAGWPTQVQLATVAGLTLFWITTMLPFVVPIVPILIRAVAKTKLKVFDVTWRNWDSKPSHLLKDSGVIALIFGVIFVILVITPVGDSLFSTIKLPLDAFWIKSLTVVTALGILLLGPVVGLLAKSNQGIKVKGETRS